MRRGPKPSRSMIAVQLASKATDDCILWPHDRAARYGQIQRMHGGRTLATGVHRYIYSMSKGWIGNLQVCHRCDTPKCINPRHLFLGTQSVNIRDMHAKGRAVGNRRKSRG